MPIVKVTDIEMHYEVLGQGEPFVIVGGLGTDARLYQTLARSLSERYRVVTFDNRGAGLSGKPDIPYTIEMMAEDTAGLLGAVGIKRANVLGFSMGGRIALALALGHPDLVRSLVLVSTSARASQEARRSPRFRLFKFIKWVRAGIPGSKSQPYFAFIRQLGASGSYDCAGRLVGIHVPTLIINGDRDRLAPPPLVEEMRSGIRGSRMVTLKGGHMILIWRSREIVDAVKGFLDEVYARG